MDKVCSRCGEGKPESEWYPSCWEKPNQWCRECYRAWHRDRYTPKNGEDDSPRICGWCGESYRPKQRRASTYCSRICKGKARAAAQAAERVGWKPVDRYCLHCAVQMPQAMRSDAVFCSEACSLAAHSLQRSLRRRTGEGMTGWLRAEIFNRDGWRCGICRKKVNPDLRYPDPMAPSLDHVIPIAEGGMNDAANLRLTHLRCNCSRRNRGGNEQLAII